MLASKPNIFSYLDYRRFLGDYYAENKKKNPSFSLRYFGHLAGLRSYNYLKLIIEGKRNLTPTFLEPFAKAMHLDPDEKAYLKKLIELGHEKHAENRSEQLAAILRDRPRSKVQIVSNAQIVMCKDWFYIPILELTEIDGFRNDVYWIARRLGISPAKAKQAIADLVNCGLLIAKGRSLKRSYTLADTTDEMSHILIKNYHQKNLQKASQSVFEQEVNEREFSSLTFTADSMKLKRMKDRIKEFRKEFFKLMDEPCERPTDVYQFNIQLFRITKPNGENK